MDPTTRRRLGRTALEVSALGFGAAPIGGFRATIPEAEARAIVDTAWNEGVRLFDTSPYYGYGRSELRKGLRFPEDSGRVRRRGDERERGADDDRRGARGRVPAQVEEHVDLRLLDGVDGADLLEGVELADGERVLFVQLRGCGGGREGGERGAGRRVSGAREISACGGPGARAHQ